MGKIAFVFSGQGTQTPGMGQALAGYSKAAEGVFSMAEAIRPGTKTQCFQGTKEELNVTLNTQPCLFCVDLAAAAALHERGVVPEAVAGFSLGEIPALAFAGMMPPEEAFRLVCVRAKAMQDCTENEDGGMAAVMGLPNDLVEAICREVDLVYPVNYNCPKQLVVAGSKGKLTELAEAVRTAGGKSIALKVRGAFHSPYMAQAQAVLEDYLAQHPLVAPRISVYANLTAEPYALPYEKTLARQVAQPVRWQDTIERMAADGITTFIEVGYGKTLVGLIRKTLPEAITLQVDGPDSLETTIRTLNGDRVC